jgi:hypothetical protein
MKKENLHHPLFGKWLGFPSQQQTMFLLWWGKAVKGLVERLKAQERLPSKCEVLSSNPSATKKRKKKRLPFKRRMVKGWIQVINLKCHKNVCKCHDELLPSTTIKKKQGKKSCETPKTILNVDYADLFHEHQQLQGWSSERRQNLTQNV